MGTLESYRKSNRNTDSAQATSFLFHRFKYVTPFLNHGLPSMALYFFFQSIIILYFTEFCNKLYILCKYIYPIWGYISEPPNNKNLECFLKSSLNVVLFP